MMFVRLAKAVCNARVIAIGAGRSNCCARHEWERTKPF